MLDKDETGTLSASFKSIIIRIIFKYYGLNDYEWLDLDMDSPYQESSDDYIDKRFIINIINEKKGNRFGSITTETILL